MFRRMSFVVALVMSIGPTTSIASAEDAFFALQKTPGGRNTLKRFNIGGPVVDIGPIPDPMGTQFVYATEFDNQGRLWASFQYGNLAIVNQLMAGYTIIGNSGVGFEAIAFGQGGSLFGVASGSRNSSIYLIDQSDAYATFLAELDIIYGIVGMVFDENNSLFYGIDWRSGLYEIDLNFQTTNIGTIPGLPNPRALTIGPNGDFFALTRSAGLFKIDPYRLTATDMMTPVPWDNQSLAYGPIPESGTLLLLGLGGAIFLRKRGN